MKQLLRRTLQQLNIARHLSESTDQPLNQSTMLIGSIWYNIQKQDFYVTGG
jgi:hypothetical protein